MISSIRNPRIRKPLVVLYAPIYFALAFTSDVLVAVERYAREMAARDWRIVTDAWHGR
jgi:hypothetical protein